MEKRKSPTSQVVGLPLPPTPQLDTLPEPETPPKRLGLLIVVWYLSSCVAITTSKICMTEAKVPFLLCSTQCLTAAVLTRCYLEATGTPSVLHKETRWLVKISGAYSSGFALTNVAFSLATAAFVETVKSSEPVSTAALALVLLGERESFATYISLVPVVFGVGMATSAGSFVLSKAAFFVVLASNLCFSFRAVLVKELKRRHPHSTSSRSAIALFYHVSRFGLPAFLLAALIHREFHFFLVLRNLFQSQDDDLLRRSSSGQWWSPSSALLIAAAFFTNGVAYTTYNMASFVVLSQVSTTTHAVLNVFRRVVVICVTTLYFRTPLSITNLAGVLTAAFGVAAFATSKGTPTKSPQSPQPPNCA